MAETPNIVQFHDGTDNMLVERVVLDGELSREYIGDVFHDTRQILEGKLSREDGLVIQGGVALEA